MSHVMFNLNTVNSITEWEHVVTSNPLDTSMEFVVFFLAQLGDVYFSLSVNGDVRKRLHSI